MRIRPATIILVACVSALFGFAGAASRPCTGELYAGAPVVAPRAAVVSVTAPPASRVLQP